MTFRDDYPEDIEFDIDRDKLRKYSQMQAAFFCLLFFVFLGLFIAVLRFEAQLKMEQGKTLVQLLGILVLNLVGCIAAGVLCGGASYFVFCHFPEGVYSRNLRLKVEGPYLRLISGTYIVSDRRIHFREITDYSTHQDPIQKWLGIKWTLQCGQGSRPTLRHRCCARIQNPVIKTHP
jgi:hypothetical protein